MGWLSPKEVDEAVGECVGGDCEKAKAIIRMSAYMGASPLMQIIGSYVVNTLRNHSFSTFKIRRMVPIKWYALRRLMMLNEFFEFSSVGEFRPRTVFDAYWQFVSLVNLRLPFIIRSRFDPISEDVCGAFGDEKLCHMYIAGYLIAEVTKSAKPYRRFKWVGTTHPASIVTLLGIINHFAKHGIMSKAYIEERQRAVFFVLSDLPKDIERFIEDALRNPVSIAELADEEFLALLSSLIAGDGSIRWSRGIANVTIVGNLEREKPLYAIIQSELKRRLGVEASLYEWKNSNTIELYTQYYDAVRLLQMLPLLIEPLKELRRQLLLNKDKLGTHLAGELFRLLGDGKRNGEKGIRKLQSYQAIRFLTTLTRLRLIRLKPEEGHYILETPTNPRGQSPSGSPRRTAHLPVPARMRAGS